MDPLTFLDLHTRVHQDFLQFGKSKLLLQNREYDRRPRHCSFILRHRDKLLIELLLSLYLYSATEQRNAASKSGRGLR